MERESADAPRVLVTSGGTACPIDDVRLVTNIGTGLFGSQIAESLLRSGCRVHYLHSRGARRPFFRCGEVDFDADLESELARVRGAHAQYERCRDRLTLVEAPTFDDYAREARRIVSELPIEIAVMTIAASDYAPVRAGGKLLFVVGFKLSSGVERGKMVESTRAWMRRGEYPLAVANDLTARRLPEREVCLLGPGDQVRDFAGVDVASPLVEAILAAYRGRF
jgi:phosphopantothenoylcysteine decarboxylase/phosphopantothenate--cysteine ligase